MLGLAFQEPFLMHALLAVSTAHLSYLLPIEFDSAQKVRNQVAGAWHWSRGLPLFRRELGAKFRMAEKDKTDALLSTMMLLSIHQFMILEEDREFTSNMRGDDSWKHSFVFLEEGAAREVALNWLSVHRGFNLVLERSHEHLDDCAWSPLLQDVGRLDNLELRQWHLITGVKGRDQVERSFLEICSHATDEMDVTNPYFESLKTVLFLRTMRPIQPELFAKMFTFVGRIAPEFRSLIQERDAAALLLVCHWLSLMLGTQLWWATERAERECKAIVIFLLQREVEQCGNHVVWRLLKEPAEVVGVDL
jgi:hypothetical protein